MPQENYFCDTNALLGAIPFDYENFSIESNCKNIRFEKSMTSSVKIIIDKEETCRVSFKINDGGIYQAFFSFVKDGVDFRALYTKELAAKDGVKMPDKRVVCFDRRKGESSLFGLMNLHFVDFGKNAIEWFSSFFGDYFDLDPLWSYQYLNGTNAFSRDSIYIVPSKVQNPADTLYVK